MFAFLRKARNPLPKLVALLSVVWLAACDPIAGGGPSINTRDAIPVALLIPAGSGNSSDEALARSIRQGALLAIGDLDGVEIDLKVYNTGGTPQGAANAAVKAVDEGAKIILGPVYAQSANAAGVAVANKNVNVLSFSNNPEIAGGNVFVMGPTFQNTANRLVNYASRQGKGQILVVHDANTAGNAGRVAIQSAISRSSAQLAGVTSYEFSQQGIVAAIPNITSQAKNSGASAMFLTADTAGALPFLAQLLPEAGLRPAEMQYIGLTRWDIPAATLTLPGVEGGWFALPDPALNTQFQSRFFASYGENPHPLAGLAYDGIAAIGALAKSGNPNALTRGGLTQSSGFAGVNGVFRLRADGTNERALAVATVRDNQVVVIDPAPRSFGGAGF